MTRSRGIGLLPVLVALALAGLLLLAAAPALAVLGGSGRAAAGARYFAGTFNALRWNSVTRQRSVGLLFERIGGEWIWWEVEDGNGNGLRTAEVRSGIDRIVGGPRRLESIVEHVRLGFPPGGPFPEIPPRGGTIADTTDPVQFGRSNLIGFGPLGTSSSGTLYATDGRHALFGVVLYGRTARVQVWRYDTRSGRWKL